MTDTHLNTKKFKPLVTVVVPVYNVEKYIDATLQSIIKQDLGFENSIEIILVDDGSTDASPEICKQYRKKHPRNIRFIAQNHEGVSAARNRGLRSARGKYIHFLDSDDLISRNAYTTALAFLAKNDGVDFAALRVQIFDAEDYDHPLNYKFTRDRVADITKEPNALVFHISSCIIRKSAIRHKFDESLQISEDAKFITDLLSEKKAYGVISSARYFYRKRSGGGSAINTAHEKEGFYKKTPYEFYQYILDLWRDKDGTPHPYAQYAVAYDLQWRIKQTTQHILSEEEVNQYKDTIYRLIKELDDDVIMNQRSITISEKLFMLKAKHGAKTKNTDAYSRLKDAALKQRQEVSLLFLEKYSDGLSIEGTVPNGSYFNDLEVRIGDKVFRPSRHENVQAQKHFLGDDIYDGGGFKLTIPNEHLRGELKFYNMNRRCDIIPRRFTRLSNTPGSYRVLGTTIIKWRRHSLQMYDRNAAHHIAFELAYLLGVIFSGLRIREVAVKIVKTVAKKAHQPPTGSVSKKKKKPFPIGRLIGLIVIPLKELAVNGYIVCTRLAYFALKPFYAAEKVWIISDRLTAAGDNGEALYRYLLSKPHPGIRVYFTISKSSPDYKRLRQYGKVINRDSYWYKLLFLLSNKIISSHAEDFVYNAFRGREKKLANLYDFDFVFLQHGITKDDMSGWLNRYGKNIKLFVAAAKPEYNSLLEKQYGYTKDEIKLVGFPRYDLLHDAPKGKLIIAPTWRRNLVGEPDPQTGLRAYVKTFVRTKYFKFYQGLVNDRQLQSALKEADMTAEVYLHPSLDMQVKDFTPKGRITFKEMPYDYKTAFSEGNILLTDYSSVAFDFAYLKKPVIYTQFDVDTFYEGHLYDKGYFSYEDDGFGPVAYNRKETVALLVETIRNGSHMDEKYKQRVDSFFAYTDKNNCERVYDAIVSLDEGR